MKKMKVKSIISVILAISMLLSLAAVSNFSISAAEEDFEYTIADGENRYATITAYKGAGGNVAIPERLEGAPVRYIAEYAFMNNSSITGVTIPSSVKAIDRYAFFMCENLANLSLNDGLKYIGTAAFNSCSALTTLFVPDTVLYIDDYAFYNCTSLAMILLGKRVEYIGEKALGVFSQLQVSGSDNETYWVLYDEIDAMLPNVRITGFKGTAAQDYVNNTSKLSDNYTNSGDANVNAVGDVNGDNTINIKDATIIQKISAEILDLDKYDLFVVDVDDDNSVTGNDITAIQKHIVGYDVVLGGESYDIPYSGSDPDLYTGIPTVKFYDITDADKANGYAIKDIIKMNSKDYSSTSRVVMEGIEGFDEPIESYVNIKLQGSSSMGYAKKNFTIKLVKDAQESKKNKMEIVDGWGNESKYCLKANYIDHTHARNVVSAKLWGDIVRTRNHVHENLKDLVNGGAIDGFPIKVYINDEYQGLYTFNIPKDDWLVGMGDSETEKEAILCGENHWGSSAFLKAFNTNDWEIEYATDEKDIGWIESTFNTFYEFVAKASDAEFKERASEYTDIEACIDYYLFVQAICAQDCLGKNMLLLTYDSGRHWFPSAYDLDTTFGIHWNGGSFYTENTMIDTTERCNSRLWDRIIHLYGTELRQRYAELREGPLSLENIISRFEDFTAPIAKGLYAIDSNGVNPTGQGYTVPQNDCSTVNQIANFIARRFKLLDEHYGYNPAK